MVGKNLKKFRKQERLTQREVGEKIGVSQRTISDWEKGTTEPNLDCLQKILKLFDITFEELTEK